MDKAVFDVYTALKSAADEVKPMRERISALEADNGSGKYSDATIQRNQEEINGLRRGIDDISFRTVEGVKEIVNKHSEILRAADDLNAADLTDDVKLLNCGVELTSRDIISMLERNKGTNTMLQLIGRYATAHNLDMGGYVYRNGADQIREIEGLVGTARLFTDHWLATDMAHEMLERFFVTGR